MTEAPTAADVGEAAEATRTGDERATVHTLTPRARSQQPPPSDAELLGRCRGGDGAAWDEIVRRYERLTYSVALRNGLSAEDAADVTQIAFVSLFDSLGRIREEERLASWLMTVARRQSWRIRNAGRRLSPLDHAPEASTDPLADWETTTVLHDALADLGDPCRELLVALYFEAEEPSYAEIADRMGRAIGGIGPMRGRCLAKLRQLLEEVPS
ncbi:MAG: RNA polymerase sigma factor [Marmoricola sp.]